MGTRGRGRRLTLATILVGLSVISIACWVAWPHLMVRYHLWRLDVAETRTEAGPWLEALARDVQRPGFSSGIVSLLGSERERLTFWIFQDLKQAAAPLREEGRLSAKLGLLLPLIRDLEDRMGRDRAFLASWAHFHLWSGQGWWVLEEFTDEPPPGLGRLLAEIGVKLFLFPHLMPGFPAISLDRATTQPLVWEGWDRLMHLELLAEAWTLGMPLPSGNAEAQALLGELRTWVLKHRRTLRFNSTVGRCVPRTQGEAFQDITPPQVPLPGWHGPAPPR